MIRTSRVARIARTAGVAALLLPLTAPLFPLTAQQSLTIYNDGRVLVRRTVQEQVPRGVSRHHLALGGLDLSTLFPLDSSLVITGASYDGAIDPASVLRRAIGRKLVFRYGGPKDTISATLLSADPERYLMPDGSITFNMPGTPLFPEDLVSWSRSPTSPW